MEAPASRLDLEGPAYQLAGAERMPTWDYGTGLSYRTRIGGGIAQRGNPPPAPSANDVAGA